MTAALADLRGFEWRDEPSFRAWLVTVADREAKMAGRFHRREGRTPGREDAGAAADVVPGLRTTPSVGAMRSESRVRLEGAVSSLDPDERRVVELHTFQGLSFSETARLAGLADEDAARYVFRRALKRLGEAMGGDEA